MNSMRTSRHNVRQACDACRQRRIKCEPANAQPTVIHNPCRRCSGADLRCTFNMPVKRRGPPAKRRRTSFDQTGETDHESFESTPDISRAREAILSTTPLNNAVPAMTGRPDPPSIDHFCSESLLDAFMQDYIYIVYPNVPVVHLPTFKADLKTKRYRTDQDFLRFVLSICATVVAILPGRFAEYRNMDQTFIPVGRVETVEYVQTLLHRLKKPDHYDTPTFEKWGSALLLGWAYGYLGLRKRLLFCHAEARAFMTDMEMHRIRSYTNLDQIQTQLRKKAFWLTAMTHIHLTPEALSWDSLSDRFLFDNTDSFELLPLELDDEFVQADRLLEQPPGLPALAVGFNALARVNSCLVLMKKDSSSPPFQTVSVQESPRDFLGTCECGRHVVPTPLLFSLQSRLRNLDDVPDELPSMLGSSLQEQQTDQQSLRAFQYKSMRANIHVTHRWVQSLLIERMIALSDVPGAERIQLWQLQIDVSAKLLDFLQDSPMAVLEPHGHLLSFKIRQVAAVLLDYPLDAGLAAAGLASSQIRAFAKILGQLDAKHAKD